ncbi:NAD-dependent epimerase/dehydratase family protein [Ligilactobacillus cholophilus]|uniref:NAD-dependent epimerase/dehydratase family protein n=1 Tax=Ligilactobacillus cholophilus TaxID=3050131 RepID=UPI0025B0983E|nr:NAD-dependent epimerase/dehydratase family protein [Ligilactobacillus cholophilus]
MSNVLITGGAGFVGSNLADRLIKQGDHITIVDDLSMGLIENIPDSDQVDFFEESITNKAFMENLLVKNKFDYIYLFAGVASVADSVARPYETHQVNQEANIFLLEVIRKNKLPVKKVLFASSAAVYGDDPVLPKKEVDSRIKPLTPYAIDKFASERYMVDYRDLYGIPTVAVRFFNIYGPKQNPSSPYSGVISIITECIRENKVFNLYGDGNQVRDFVYIDDVIDALMLLTRDNNASYGVYNVASGLQTSVNDMIQAYENITGKTLQIDYKPERKGDIKYSYADISKLSKLGYCPIYNIEDGLKKYWEYVN